MKPVCATNDEHSYDEFQKLLHKNFEQYANKRLFTTNAEGLFDLYLDGIPEAYRQHYNCHACKRFIETYGGLVAVSQEGRTTSVMWSLDEVPALFQDSVAKMEKAVSKAKVTGVFLDKNNTWGIPVTGEWNHLHVVPAKEIVFSSRLQTAFQASSEKREDFKNMILALSAFPLDAIKQALNILNQEALYRSEKVIGIAKWLKELHETIAANKAYKANIVWAAVAAAPPGYCHPRSSMIGTLLEDIVSGLPFDTIKSRFDAKMHPLQYQRPQAAPSVANIAEAEKVIEKLRLAKSLDRRYAKLEEIRTIWVTKSAPQEAPTGGIFGHLKTKDGLVIKPVDVPAKPMTWAKFYQDILPAAERIEFLVPGARSSYAAILTAVHEDAPPILQWDNEQQRNPFSWYLYHGGSFAKQWMLDAGKFCKVNAVCLQPSMWFGAEHTHQGTGVMFVLNGAKDFVGDKVGNCLFPEMLRSDLRSIRSTLEAYSKEATLSGLEDASACGVLLQKGVHWNAEFLVTSDGISNRYRLDRWE